VAATRAVILAAGRGVRMGGTEPKTLMAVGEHRPLLDYLLRGLRSAGLSDLMIVTGFAAARIKDFVSDTWDGEPPTYLFNARYASWGNFHSLRIALDQSPGLDVVVVNSDIVIHPDVFTRVRRTFGDLVLAVQTRPRLDAEDMRVELDGDRVTSVSKQLTLSSSRGEFCGVSLVRPRAARLYLEAATELEWRAQTGGYYEDVYDAILSRVDARAARVDEGEYAEVDTPQNVESAAAVLARHADAWEPSAPLGER
jgi:choline kinase